MLQNCKSVISATSQRNARLTDYFKARENIVYFLLFNFKDNVKKHVSKMNDN